MNRTQKKSFWALMVTQFFGAFNDNVLKVLVTILIIQWVSEVSMQEQLVSLSGVIFVVPFLLFSMIAGRIADRIGKPRVIVATKYWELLVVTVASLSLLAKSVPFMMGGLFLLSMQAAFFSPAKYGIVPELMGETEISRGNGWLNAGTFAAILGGTIVGSLVSENRLAACAVLIGASAAGLIASFFMEPLAPAKPQEKISLKPLSIRILGILGSLYVLGQLHVAFHAHRYILHWGETLCVVSAGCFLLFDPDLISNCKLMAADRGLWLGSIAVNYFWFMGAILQLNIFLYASQMMKAVPEMSGMLLVPVMLGIGAGSFIAGAVSGQRIELGLVPLGALGMSLFAVDLGWAYHSMIRLVFDLFMLGFSAGFYDIPLTALVQWRSPKGERGRVLATINYFSFVAILGASGMLWLLNTVFDLNPAQVFFTLGSISLVGTVILCVVFPEARQRFELMILRFRKPV